MIENHFKIRLTDLEDHIRQDLEFLKEYENALRLEDDPRRTIKYQREVERTKKSSALYQKEYEELHLLLKQQPSLESTLLVNQLTSIQQGINKLQLGQRVIFNNINCLHTNILQKFDEIEQSIISTGLSKVDTSQLNSINSIIEAIDKSHLSDTEIRQLNSITELASNLKIDNMPVETKNIIELLKSSELTNNHKMILTIPIIPMILSYEHEIEISTGINIVQAWQMLLKRIKGDAQ